jgi:hypothetical protein
MNPACELEAVAKMLKPTKPDFQTIARIVGERITDRLARAMGLP